MAARKGTECLLRPRSKLTSEVHLHLCGSVFIIDKELLALKSAKIGRLLHKNPQGDLSQLLRDIPADEDSMELVARFCHGFEINLSTQNVVRVACVADYLGMTETHCPNNLLHKALLFFEQQIIPSWNNSIKALKNAEHVFDHARQLRLVDYCVDSIVLKASDDPRLLGEPIKKLSFNSGDDGGGGGGESYKPNARRKLFDINWKLHDITELSLGVYAHIIHAMVLRGVPHEYIAASLIQYAKTWMFSRDKLVDEMSRNHQREIVEALVVLMPNEINILPCTYLCEMLRFAIGVNANTECKNALEVRIGKQLDQASVEDLVIRSEGYAHDERYDTECLMRILKNFCNYANADIGALNSVAELIDEFLAEISSDMDLKIRTFTAVADMSIALSEGTQRSSDGVYKAVDIYLDKHRHLTESEKEDLCKVLDCNKLSDEACEHAARNERLPVRMVVKVLFVTQLKIREGIVKEVKMEEGGGGIGCGEEEDMRVEIEKMGSKVLELERECSVMKREMERSGKRKKVSMWREMKRKIGCVTSMHDCNCHVKKKKVHPT